MKIDIVGWHQRLNVGDEAFAIVFNQIFKEHQLKFTTPPNCPSNSDIVILGGGDVVKPYYLKTLPNNLPLYALGIGIGYESEIDLMTKYPFKEVYVRNGTDVTMMQSKLSCPITAIPDLAFFLKPRLYPKVLKRYMSRHQKIIAVLATDYINPAIDRPVAKFADQAWNCIQQIASELDHMSEKGWKVILVPCSTGGYGNDRRINLDIAAFMKNQPIIVEDTLSPIDMIDLLSQVDLSLCMRFHGHIFSIIANTPFVSIGTTRKVQLLLQENDLNDTKGNDLRMTIESVISKSALYKMRFSEITKANKEELDKVTQRVRQSWTGGCS